MKSGSGSVPSVPWSDRWAEYSILDCRGDDCYCQTGMPVHPPVLMVFDPGVGKYVPAEDVCTAVWASAGIGRGPAHVTGQLCGRPATKDIGDVRVCDHHYKRAAGWVGEMAVRDAVTAKQQIRELHEERMRLDREQAAQQIALDGEAILAAEAARSEFSVVYYVQRDSDGLIKIGTSRAVWGRLDALRSAHGALRLLATQGGDYQDEHATHWKFAALRVEGEWFRPELPLLDHILWVRSGDLLRSPKLPECVDVAEIRRAVRELKKRARAARASAGLLAGHCPAPAHWNACTRRSTRAPGRRRPASQSPRSPASPPAMPATRRDGRTPPMKKPRRR